MITIEQRGNKDSTGLSHLNSGRPFTPVSDGLVSCPVSGWHVAIGPLSFPALAAVRAVIVTVSWHCLCHSQAIGCR